MKIIGYIYEADDGKVFDNANLDEYVALEYDENGEETGNLIQEHYYQKTIYIEGFDSIDNYVEIDDPRVK